MLELARESISNFNRNINLADDTRHDALGLSRGAMETPRASIGFFISQMSHISSTGTSSVEFIFVDDRRSEPGL